MQSHLQDLLIINMIMTYNLIYKGEKYFLCRIVLDRRIAKNFQGEGIFHCWLILLFFKPDSLNFPYALLHSLGNQVGGSRPVTTLPPASLSNAPVFFSGFFFTNFLFVFSICKFLTDLSPPPLFHAALHVKSLFPSHSIHRVPVSQLPPVAASPVGLNV